MNSSTSEKKRYRDFGYLVGLGFPGIFGLIIPILYGHDFRVWTCWIGLPILILSIFSPRLLAYPYKGWMALGHALGFINRRLILGGVYILVLLPISLLMRIFGHDPLRKKKNN